MISKNAFAKFVLSATWIFAAAFPLVGSATEHNPGTWMTFSASDTFRTEGEDSRWRYWFDAQARYFDVGSGINQWLVRPAIGYEISDSVNAWFGYARFRTRNRAGTIADENRYWQQIDWAVGRWENTRASMRVRLEQRSLSIGEDTGLVFRFMTKFVRPIGVDGRTSLVLGIEPFVDLRDTDWGGDAGLGQNRTFIGLGWRLTDRFSMEAGYMNQYVWIDNAENLSNHFGVLNFSLR